MIRIPFEKGKELAEKYEVLDRMMPLLTFDPASIANNEEIPTKEQVKEQVQLEAQQQIDRLLSDSPPRSPLTGELDGHRFSSGPLLLHGGGHKRPQQFQHHKHSSNKKLKLAAVVGSPDSAMEEEFDQEEVDEGGEVGGFLEEEEAEIYKGGEAEEEEFDEHHRNLLMNIFLSDNPDDTPSALASTLLTNDVNIDLVIDEQGHTALHWAAALGRTKIVDLLISNGANVCSVNFEGETPLMRAAMITCCFENKCFAHMVEMMSDAITVFDKRGRTILHHIALTADVGGYEDAAIYYMKRLFKTAPKKIVLKNMMNIQDRVYGETALAIALRAGCLEIGDFLTKQGAVDPLTSNLEPDQTLEYVPVNYKQHSKGQDIINCKFVREKCLG
jgi:regulatory protein SWI6